MNGARTTATGSRNEDHPMEKPRLNMGGNLAEMCSKRGKRQILYMQLKKNKNKKKNYSRKSVFLYKWLRSVGVYD